MAKGFGKRPEQSGSDEILVSSMVASKTLKPAVQISWGKEQAQIPIDAARHHAYAVLEAIAAAELDACLMQWATQKLGVSPMEAGQILILFRQKRESGQIPSVTMNLGREHIRPDTARKRAEGLMMAAFGTEIEAFLVAFLIQDLDQSPEVADQIIQEFREMRGATTMWPETESDEPI
jgi:hypothetical protein